MATPRLGRGTGDVVGAAAVFKRGDFARMKRMALLTLTLFGLALAAASDPAPAGDKKAAKLTDEQFVKYVHAQGKYLQEALAKGGKLDKKANRMVVASALLLMAYSIDGDHADSASVRQNAAELYDAVVAGNFDKAKALAGTFAPTIQKRKEKLTDDKFRGDYGKLMVFFAPERIGGFSVEKELGDLAEQKDKLSPAQFERLAELGHKMGAIVVAGRVAPPDAAKGKKDWPDLVAEFGQAVTGLTAAAEAKNEAGTRQGLEKLEKTCNQCHDIYR
jgi:hypothetical protein